MSPEAGVFDLTVAFQHGVGQAMHRVPPVMAVAQGVRQQAGTVLLTAQQLDASSVYDRQCGTWKTLDKALTKAFTQTPQRPLDIALGEHAPWWLVIVQYHRLQRIAQNGITQVTANFEHQQWTLTFTTENGHWHVRHDKHTRELKTEQFEG